jgi:hypothetical protein
VRAVSLAALALLLGAAPAAAKGSIKVSPNSVPAGGTVTVSGSAAGGCASGDQVTLISRAFGGQHEFAGVPAVFTPSGSNGSFSVRAPIPSSRAPGNYSVSGRCGGGNFGSASFRVTAASTTLPRTGLSPGLLAALGVCLVAGGAALRRVIRPVAR